MVLAAWLLRSGRKVILRRGVKRIKFLSGIQLVKGGVVEIDE